LKPHHLGFTLRWLYRHPVRHYLAPEASSR
jgi:hypothetical protein